MFDLRVRNVVACEVDSLEILEIGKVLKTDERAISEDQHLEVVQLFE